jgi:streptogramin lyase
VRSALTGVTGLVLRVLLNRRFPLALVLAAVTLGAGTVARAEGAGTVTEFSAGITAGSDPVGIAAGPDGNLWFTEYGGSRVGRITPAGAVTEFSAGITADGTAGSGPSGIAAGPDGNLWFTELYGNRIGRITPAGAVTEFSAGITADSGDPYGIGAGPDGIAVGPDGNLWFTEYAGNRIGRITPAGAVTEFSAGITAGSQPDQIAAGPDGNLWFTETRGNRVGRITPAGAVTEFSAGITAGSGTGGIAAGRDGNLWFTEYAGNRIGRISTGAAACHSDSSCGYGRPTDADRDGIPDALETALAQKFAPTMIFHPDEPNFPVSVDWLLARTWLQWTPMCSQGLSPVTDGYSSYPLRKAPSQLDLLFQSEPGGGCAPVDGNVGLTSDSPHPDEHSTHGDLTCQGVPNDTVVPWQTFSLSTVSGRQRAGDPSSRGWPTYVHVYPAFDGGVVIQYWHLFSYNDYQGFASGCDKHGGDWDASVQVRLDQQLQPKEVVFSRHSHDNPGDAIPWSQISTDGPTGHPLVIVDAGGHATYANPGDFCAYRSASVEPANGGEGSWPEYGGKFRGPNSQYGGNPPGVSVQDLHDIQCNPGRGISDGNKQGGTLWRIDRGGGSVTSNSISSSGADGGLSNLGEYNPEGKGGTRPCDPGGRCVGLPPGPPFSGGSYYPLDGNLFIGYSGLWADPQSQSLSGFAFPPRGPVFQGLDGNLSTLYHLSWYNLAAADAASPTWVPWLRSGALTRDMVAAVQRALQGTHPLPHYALQLGSFRNTGVAAEQLSIAVSASAGSGAQPATAPRGRGARTLARLSFSLAPGGARKVVLHLNRALRRPRALAERGLPISISITLTSAGRRLGHVQWRLRLRPCRSRRVTCFWR